jgi:hypothetical protein
MRRPTDRLWTRWQNLTGRSYCCAIPDADDQILILGKIVFAVARRGVEAIDGGARPRNGVRAVDLLYREDIVQQRRGGILLHGRRIARGREVGDVAGDVSRRHIGHQRVLLAVMCQLAFVYCRAADAERLPASLKRRTTLQRCRALATHRWELAFPRWVACRPLGT